MSSFLDENHVVTGSVPTADYYEGSPATDVINMANYGHCCWIISEGAGGTATNVITVEECTSAAFAGNTPIAFNYRVCNTTDTWGALTAATSAGYTTIAGANKMIAIEIEASELDPGYPFVRLQFTEAVDSPAVAGVVAILTKARYPQSIPVTAIV